MYMIGLFSPVGPTILQTMVVVLGVEILLFRVILVPYCIPHLSTK